MKEIEDCFKGTFPFWCHKTVSYFSSEIYLISTKRNILSIQPLLFKLQYKNQNVKIQMEYTYTFYAERPNSKIIERTFRRSHVNLERILLACKVIKLHIQRRSYLLSGSQNHPFIVGYTNGYSDNFEHF